MPWPDGLAGVITPLAITLFVIVNGTFAAGIILTRNRNFVNRWTRTVLTADAVLVIAAIGAPVAAVGLKLVAKELLAIGALPGRMIHSK